MKKILAIVLLGLCLLSACAKKETEPAAGEKLATAASDFGAPYDSIFADFRKAVGQGDFAGALTDLRASLRAFWEKSPLLLENVRFVKSASNSFGLYEPKSGEEFNESEVVYLYLEPSGYTVAKSAEGKHEFGFNVDFILEDASGKVIGGQKEFAQMNFSSWNFNTEIALTFTYTFSGLEKGGRYKLLTTVRDAKSDKNSSVENWIKII
jgi:hypothetical protein